ncbi:hypothetical protein GCM10027052_19430 [Parafrigoribacterium mesophilum]|uniref:hypothetical protein n=1 Tax=Parafrigoribacterium mesophilum TaxID=433646 RepID=UPI0031FD6A8B
MPKQRDSVSAQNRATDLLAPRSAVGGTSASIAKLQIDNLHSSLAATVGQDRQGAQRTREKD